MTTAHEQLVDELLVLRCQNGDGDAVDELARRYQRPCWLHALRMTGSEDAAWECTQESWMAILKGVRRLEDPAVFRAWAYRIVTNKAADWVKSRSRSRNRQSQMDPDTVSKAQADGSIDDQEQVQVLLAQLEAGERVVLSLRYLEEFSNVEIAHILSIPEGTAKSRLYSARQKLKKLLEGGAP